MYDPLERGEFVMDNCTCENCGRTSEVVEITKLTICNHTAQLCVTCAQILSQVTNHERFLSLVRSKGVVSSNKEMQKVHKQLSALIGVGVFFIACIASIGIVKNVDFISAMMIQQPDQQVEYLSFAVLNKFK